MHAYVICIGAVLVDELFFCQEEVLPGTSNPAHIKKSVGGVISNVARNLALLDVPVRLLSFLGNDGDADWLEEALRQSGVDTRMLIRANEPTGKFTAIIGPDGSLFTAACNDNSEKVLTPAVFESVADQLRQAKAIVADANISVEAINWLSSFCHAELIPLFLEPVSVAKARKLSKINKRGVYMMTPNEDELPSISGLGSEDENGSIRKAMGEEVEFLWLRKGAAGSVLFHKGEELYLPAPAIAVTDSTGAGDSALAGYIAGWFRGADPLTSLKWGHCMAAMVLMQSGTIAEHANETELKKLVQQYYPET